MGLYGSNPCIPQVLVFTLLFMVGLFVSAFNSSYCIVLSNGSFFESLIGNDVQGSAVGLIWGPVPEFLLGRMRKPMKIQNC